MGTRAKIDATTVEIGWDWEQRVHGWGGNEDKSGTHVILNIMMPFKLCNVK